MAGKGVLVDTPFNGAAREHVGRQNRDLSQSTIVTAYSIPNMVEMAVKRVYMRYVADTLGIDTRFS